ncbi:hypothetical protein L7F22_036699 [Adiantum nelumboides]|nr:hypothetical protein [Adiantum nelumboides]
MADSTIHLSNLEEKIFDTLKAVLVHFKVDSQLRVAGGWVRDKLLGQKCHDIEIALKTCWERPSVTRDPKQSKHLESARMKIFGVDIDFVNLRADTYAENSYISSTQFGTPEEDALRRDLTINSLFYNINTGSIEDFTGRGLPDLHEGTIATPLPPKTTLLDDPFRVLRALRFAARFDYSIQEDLRQAAADVAVRTALSNRISREQVGVEIDAMINGELGLYAALLPPSKSFNRQLKYKQTSLARIIMVKSSKLSAQDASAVVGLHHAVDDSSTVFKVLLNKEEEFIGSPDAEDWEVTSQSIKMIGAGLWITEKAELWRVALLLGSLAESSMSDDLQDHQIKKTADRYLAAEAVILNSGLENVWKLKLLLNGNEIMSELGLENGCPEIKEWQTQIRKWQLCHMTATAEDCREWFQTFANRYRQNCKFVEAEQGAVTAC